MTSKKKNQKNGVMRKKKYLLNTNKKVEKFCESVVDLMLLFTKQLKIITCADEGQIQLTDPII